MTYICREEECWSLSNVGYGPRTRQVILAHKPLLFTVIFSFAVFPNSRGELHSRWVCRFDWCTEFDSCYILQGQPQSIWWEPGQGYIKGILVSPQQSAAQVPGLCFALPDRCPSDCFSEPTFQRDNPIPLAASVTSGPLPPLSFNPISPSFRNALHSLPLFSRLWCPRQSLGTVCLVVPDLFILSGERGYIDLLCVQWSPSHASV